MKYTLPRSYALLLGTLIILIGIAGFIDPLKSNGDQLFGLFAVNSFHNGVHILTGLPGILLMVLYRGRYASWYLLALGLVYGILTILGFILNGDFFELTYFTTVDNLLHAGIAIVAMLFGIHVALSTPELYLGTGGTSMAK